MSSSGATAGNRHIYLEEKLGDGWYWRMHVSEVLCSQTSRFQDIELVKTEPFGTALLLDGKMQSSHSDEWMYHECLVHPALLHHPNPRRVFICGGGEGATAREVLRHKSVEQVVMVDIDEIVCQMCEKHIPENSAAFKDPRLKLINDDALAQLEAVPDGSFDVIIGDLADPLEGGPCYLLYTQEFYRDVVMKKLAPGGIFITQSGPAGVETCREVMSFIHSTLKSVFPKVVAYRSYFPSFCDLWGFNVAFSKEQELLSADEFDKLAQERITGTSPGGTEGEPLRFLDGEFFRSATVMPKIIRRALAEETELFTKDNPRFLVSGEGLAEKN
ncbi:unnamed protein product [Pedinophyceae sp. YPF-701]|nr:unnamed protein product [Pedinophyceae sp. YPF-701]